MPSQSTAGAAESSARMLSVVIPVHNEEDCVEPLIGELRAVLEGSPYEIVFVDDMSTDRTVQVLSSISAADTRIRVVRMLARAGKSAALAAGFREVRGEIVATMDGDLQDDPANLPEMVRKLDQGFDLVSGWKVPRKDPLRRRIASKIFNAAVRRMSGLKLHDVNCGMKVYRYECVTAIVDDCVGDMHRFLPVFAHSRGFRVGELPITHRPRTNGRSRYGLERYAHGMLDMLSVLVVARFAHKPMHALGGAGLIASSFGAASLGWYIAASAGTGTASNLSALIGVALLLLGAQLVLAGVLAEAIVHRSRWPIAHTNLITLPEEPSAPAPLMLVRDHAGEGAET